MTELLSRLATGIKAFRAGYAGIWSPGEPSKAITPAGTPPMQYQYPWGYNLQSAPRPNEPVTFSQLRALADNYDLLRLAIETRKDQIEGLKWTVTPIGKTGKAKSHAEQILQLLRKPDRQHSFHRWLRMWMEDVHVIDAASIYIRRTRGGDIYSLDLVDGSTIRPNIDDSGRLPEPPFPAYQQIIFGQPAVDLTTDELFQPIRNPRTNKVYGYSHVEQIIATVNIALLRQTNQKNYYTEGNIPEAFLSTPESWQMQQVIEFQAYWDSLFESNTSMRRKARFIPNGVTPTFTKDNPLKDEYDEWLARIISYCFTLPPTALGKETNRAVAQTTQESGKAEGLTPIRNYVKEAIDSVIHDHAGYDDAEFSWEEEEINNPLEQAQVNQIYYNIGALDADEIREQIGKEPLSDEQKAAIASRAPSYPMFSAGITGGAGAEAKSPQNPPDGPDPEIKKRRPRYRARAPLPMQTSQLRLAQRKLQGVLQNFLKKAAGEMTGQILNAYDKLGKSDTAVKEKAKQILEELDLQNWSMLFDDVEPILEEIAMYGGSRALAQVGVSDQGITELVNRDAVSYAHDRAAEMIGKVWSNNRLVDNPNPELAISESTRGYLRSNLEQAIEEGWSPQKLADHIAENTGFSSTRAEMIARTEVAEAHTQGSLAAWSRSGVVQGKQSILGSEHDLEDECDINADAGVIPLEEDFPSGDDGPPYHPNCTCAVVPVVIEDE